MNGSDSHDGTAQKLKYKIILTQDIAYVKRIKLYIAYVDDVEG